MVRIPSSRLWFVAAAAAAAMGGLVGCAEDAPLRVTVVPSWVQAPTGDVWLWARVEGREDPTTPGRTLAGQGPIQQAPGEPVEIAFEGLAAGAGRVVVVEARWAPDTVMPVRWYGVSESLSLGAGDKTVSVAMQPPQAEVHQGAVELLFDGVPRERAAASEVGAATVRVRSSGAVSLLVANDAAASANATTFARGDLACEVDDVAGVAWDVCDVAAWDLLAGLPVGGGDGVYTVYVWLVDAAGYAALPLSRDVVLDSVAPTVVGATVTPNPAADGDEVVVSLTLDERIDVDATWLHATSRDAQPAPVFLGPESLGAASSTYRWVATLTHEHDGATVDFAATLTDLVGNVAAQVPLTAGRGTPLVLDVSP